MLTYMYIVKISTGVGYHPCFFAFICKNLLIVGLLLKQILFVMTARLPAKADLTCIQHINYKLADFV